jgi:type III restriction enzyme
VRKICYGYATDYQKWWQVAENISAIKNQNDTYRCNYAQSMEVDKDANGNDIEVSFAPTSHYTDNGNYVNIGDWVWQRRDKANKFAFDSDAEREWASILKDLSAKSIAPTKVGKIKKELNQGEAFDEVKSINEKEIFLWGKNYVPNSAIKFEYYMGALHSSFPDFVMKDCFGRIHIFEVKSVNEKPSMIDNNIYKAKIAELKNCYKQASAITRQIFYLPVLDGDVWQITQYKEGEEETLTKDSFLSSLIIEEK